MPKKLTTRMREAARKRTTTTAPEPATHDPGDWWLLTDAVMQLRSVLSALRFPLPTPDAPPAREQVGALVAQLDDYVIPRLKSLDAPLLAVVGGSTGAGKSTLVNSLVGRVVSQPGVLRPTTRSPVLVYAPEDVAWFGDGRVLPGLTRSNAPSADPSVLQLMPERSLAPGLALLDAPDVDSVVASNRQLARELLAAADLWIFVTTAARYADAVPWQVLAQASSRDAAVALVLDRVPLAAVAEVSTHLQAMMAANGLPDAPLFVIPETTPEQMPGGLLPAAAIEGVQQWLWTLAADEASRAAVVRQTLDGTLASLSPRLEQVRAHLHTQQASAQRVREVVNQAYTQAADGIDAGIGNGSLLRGQVLARWQEFVGSPEFFANLQTRLGRLRDRVTRALRGSEPPQQRLEQAVESGVETVIVNAADKAAAQVASRWRADPTGAGLLAHAETAGGSGAAWDRRSPDVDAAARQLVQGWQGAVLQLVRREAAGKRSSAKLLSYGVNGAGAALMVLVFAHTGELTGAEVAVAGGTSVVGHKLLEALLGDQAVRELAAKARADLRERIRALFQVQQQRYLDVIETDTTTPRDVQAAADAVEKAR